METTDKTVAVNILIQLGGNKFVVATGTHNFVADNNSASMQLRRNKSGAKWLKITLTVMDDYTMEFLSIDKNGLIVTKAKYERIYCDQLQDIFTEVTGLYTTLGTMGR